MSKVYKPEIGRGPSLRPVLSAINTPYKLAIFLVPLLKSLTWNDYTINDSFSFAEEVYSFDCAHYLTSFDIESLFTNIQLEETTKICVDKFFKTKMINNNLTKESFRSLLEMGTLDFFFFFDEKHYKQKHRVAMDSPLVPTLANVFLWHFEEQWMSELPIDYKPTSYRRNLDDTFLLFLTELDVTKFLNYTNSKHWNIKFTVKRDEHNSLSFLDIKIGNWVIMGNFSHLFIESLYLVVFLLILKVFCPYHTNIILFPLWYITALWFALIIELCILKFWN